MKLSFTVVGAAVLLVTGSVSAQTPASSTRVYTEGPITVVSWIRTKPGMFEKYIEYLNGAYKTDLEAQKSAGLVTGYVIFSSPPRTPQDHDVMLTVTYKNWAAFDGLTDRADAVADRVLKNTLQQRDQQFIDRGAMREVIGSRQYQQLILK